MDGEPKTAAKKLGKRGSVEEAVSYAVGHRIRVEVLGYLNERPRSPSELAELLSYPLSTIDHHIRELLSNNSIELAWIKKVRNTNEHFYRAVELPFYDDDEIQALPFETRQATYGLALQSIAAEALAALWAGKMSNDPRTWMSWRWFNVDAQGRRDIADEQARSWARMQEIEAESANRRVESGEEAVSIIVSSLGYERCRTSEEPPATSGEN